MALMMKSGLVARFANLAAIACLVSAALPAVGWAQAPGGADATPPAPSPGDIPGAQPLPGGGAGGAGGAGGGAGPVAYPTLSDCLRALPSYHAKIEQHLAQHGRSPDYSFVMFCGSSTAIAAGSRDRDYGVVGDPIYVAFYGPKSGAVGTRVAPTKCSPRTPGPLAYPAVELKAGAFHAAGSGFAWYPDTPLSYTCFDSAVEFTLTGKMGGAETTQSYTLQQYERYTFTAQIGVAFTNRDEHSYALRTVDGTQYIRDEGPDGQGPQYFASLVVYGLPRYVQAWWKHRNYYGRDLVHDNAFADRIGLLLGFGLQNPKDEFLAGLSLELLPGINLVGAHRWAKLSELDGVAVGDAFEGAVGDLPKRDVWDTGWVAGVSIDTRYLAQIVGGSAPNQ